MAAVALLTASFLLVGSVLTGSSGAGAAYADEWEETAEHTENPPPGNIPGNAEVVEQKCYNRFTGEEVDCKGWYGAGACHVTDYVVPKHQWPKQREHIMRWPGSMKAANEGEVRHCDKRDILNDVLYIWIGPGDEVLLDPTPLVWQVIASLSMEQPEVGTVPESGADRVGLIGLPTWMWVENGDNAMGTQTAGDSMGPLTITAKAQTDGMDWDMGDGTVVHCEGPGTPYQDSHGEAESPDCGHIYEKSSANQPDQAYQVTASTRWEINWSSNMGHEGQVTIAQESDTVQLRIGEMQVPAQ